MGIRGIDLASHQGPNYPFAARVAEGYSFSIIKASGGHGYRNEYLDSQVRGARNAGMEVGFYHYMFEPTAGGGDVKREVQNFINACRPYAQPGTTFWLDVEEYPARVGFTGDLGGWIVEFCEEVEREFGCVCGIYCATWYLVPTGLSRDARLRKYPFWVASWQANPPGAQFLAPWSTWTLWQYNADIIDKDYFEGSLADLRALGIPEAAPPNPEQPNDVIPFLLDDGTPAVTIVFRGKAKKILGVDIQDLGISVVGLNDLIHDQSVQANDFKGWRVR